MRKSIVQTVRNIGKLNVVKLYFKKYNVIKLVTTHIFFYLQFFFIESLVFEIKIINKKNFFDQNHYFVKHKLR